MSFKIFIETEIFKLNALKDPTQRNEGLRVIQDNYLKEINLLIEQLNNSSDAQYKKILKQIKETDRLYLQAKEFEIAAHILFTRHAKCSNWQEKNFGLSPNAAISEMAAKNMEKTNRFTDGLLFYPANQNPVIAISPMNRAMQTAGLVIPAEINDAQIFILSFLAENSISPSGYDVRSKADMNKLYEQLSFWKSPTLKILLQISLWIYSDEDFQPLYKKRIEAAEKIQAHAKTVILEPRVDGKLDVCQNLDYQGDKIEEIKTLIESLNQQDCWLFGHAENFKAFFQHVFAIDSDFDYGETRSVYKLKSNGDKSSLFHPPYVMLINQETGKVEGRYNPLLNLFFREEIASKNDFIIPVVPQGMTELGGSISESIKLIDLK